MKQARRRGRKLNKLKLKHNIGGGAAASGLDASKIEQLMDWAAANAHADAIMRDLHPHDNTSTLSGKVMMFIAGYRAWQRYVIECEKKLGELDARSNKTERQLAQAMVYGLDILSRSEANLNINPEETSRKLQEAENYLERLQQRQRKGTGELGRGSGLGLEQLSESEKKKRRSHSGGRNV